MSTVLNFRPFKVPTVKESQFIQTKDELNQAFAITDLAKSGLSMEDLLATTSALIRLPEGASAGYYIPYYGTDGKPLTDSSGYLAMYRIRLQVPAYSKMQRYTQPNREQLGAFGLPPYVPYIHPLTMSTEGDVLVCAEGEKKCASVIKYLGLPAFGIGGCQMWRDPSGSGSIHPWIRELLVRKQITRVLIIPDGDVRRYDICNAYGTFASALEQEGYSVEILDPPGKIDDLIVSWGTGARESFVDLPKIAVTELVQSQSYLAKRYSLAFKQNDKGVMTVEQHTSNIMKLLEEHPAFPKIWRDVDTSRVMIGEKVMEPDLTEVDLANYFQHNLGFNKVTHRTLLTCIQALSKRNQKSPMLEWIRGQVWDGIPRLEEWAIKHWGVEDTPFVREVSKKWLVGACARLHKPGTKIDWMMIVVGPQGTGKTSLPNILFRGNSLTLYGESNDKDLHMKIHSALVIGFDELDSFGRRETGFLKAMITTSQDHFRPPYGASVEVFDRRCTLYGCGNNSEFLVNDPTGLRRYAVLSVHRLLDFKGLEADLSQIWAEAWETYETQRIEYWKIDGASEEARKYVIPSVLEEKIQSWLYKQVTMKGSGNAKDGRVVFMIGDLIDGLNINVNPKNPHETREIAAILKSLGCEKKSMRPPQGGSPRNMWVWEQPPE